MPNSHSEINEIERLALNGVSRFDLSEWIIETESNLKAEERVKNVILLLNLVSDSESLIEKLPGWFLDKTPNISGEEADKLLKETPREKWGELPWDRESWAEAALDRAWHFVGCQPSSSSTKWNFMLSAFPANLDTFFHIIESAGTYLIE